MNDITLIRRDGFGVALTEEAQTLKVRALETAALIGAVRNADENERAAAAMLEVRRVLKLVEEARVTVKTPVLDLCRKIDATAKEFVTDLACEEIRIAKAVGTYQQEQLELQRAAARKAAEEAERIERERVAEEQRIRQAAEAAAKLAQSSAEAKAIEAKADAALKAASERAAQQMEIVRPATAPVKAEGQTIRPVMRFEVTNIWDLVRARPDLVDPQPRKQAINEAIALLAAAGTPKIPGLRIWEEVAVSTRVGRQPKALDV